MKGTTIRLAVLLTVLVFAMASCDLFGERVSISERISRFESDLNNNLGAVHNNIHPSVQQSGQIRDPEFWRSFFDEIYRNWTISVSGGQVRTGTVTGTSIGSRTITLSFREDGNNNWKIDRIEMQGANPNPFIFR